MTAQEVEDAFKNGTETGLRFEQVKVNKVNGMTDEMIRGVDIGSYLALKNAGVKFYDFDGNEAPLMKVLKDAGVNWIRSEFGTIRMMLTIKAMAEALMTNIILWNSPRKLKIWNEVYA